MSLHFGLTQHDVKILDLTSSKFTFDLLNLPHGFDVTPAFLQAIETCLDDNSYLAFGEASIDTLFKKTLIADSDAVSK